MCYTEICPCFRNIYKLNLGLKLFYLSRCIVLRVIFLIRIIINLGSHFITIITFVRFSYVFFFFLACSGTFIFPYLKNNSIYIILFACECCTCCHGIRCGGIPTALFRKFGIVLHRFWNIFAINLHCCDFFRSKVDF